VQRRDCDRPHRSPSTTIGLATAERTQIIRTSVPPCAAGASSVSKARKRSSHGRCAQRRRGERNPCAGLVRSAYVTEHRRGSVVLEARSAETSEPSSTLTSRADGTEDALRRYAAGDGRGYAAQRRLLTDSRCTSESTRSCPPICWTAASPLHASLAPVGTPVRCGQPEAPGWMTYIGRDEQRSMSGPGPMEVGGSAHTCDSSSPRTAVAPVWRTGAYGREAGLTAQS